MGHNDNHQQLFFISLAVFGSRVGVYGAAFQLLHLHPRVLRIWIAAPVLENIHIGRDIQKVAKGIFAAAMATVVRISFVLVDFKIRILTLRASAVINTRSTINSLTNLAKRGWLVSSTCKGPRLAERWPRSLQNL